MRFLTKQLEATHDLSDREIRVILQFTKQRLLADIRFNPINLKIYHPGFIRRSLHFIF